jgi:polar amino acid transport system substrate-binding protein
MRFFLVFQLILLCCWTTGSAAEKTFTITTERFAPFIGEQFENSGWTMEVARAALESQGYKVTLDLLPWARALRIAKTGKYDGLYLSYYVKEREPWFVFSNPIGETRTGFFKLKTKNISYKTLQDLKPYTIGLTRGAAVSPDFDSAEYLTKVFITSDEQIFKMLLKGRVDLFAGSEDVGKYIIATKLPPEDQDKFEFIEPPLTVHKLHMAISKKALNYKQKLEDFNRGLHGIMSDGTYDKILERHGLK